LYIYSTSSERLKRCWTGGDDVCLSAAMIAVMGAAALEARPGGANIKCWYKLGGLGGGCGEIETPRIISIKI